MGVFIHITDWPIRPELILPHSKKKTRPHHHCELDS